MEKITLTTLFLCSVFLLAGQCDIPRNSGTVQYQNAIVYNGKIYRTDLPDGTAIFSVDPSKLGFKTHELTGETVPVSGEGVWYFIWNYAAYPNRWQPLPVDCDRTSCTLKNIHGEPIRRGWIECDFFYLDKKAGSSATFMGSVIRNISYGMKDGDRTKSGFLTDIE